MTSQKRRPLGVHMGAGVTTFGPEVAQVVYVAVGVYRQSIESRNGGGALTRQLRELEAVLLEASVAAKQVRRRTANIPEFEDLAPSQRDGWIEMKEVAKVLEVTDVHARRLAHANELGEVRKVGRSLVVRRTAAEALRDERAR